MGLKLAVLDPYVNDHEGASSTRCSSNLQPQMLTRDSDRRVRCQAASSIATLSSYALPRGKISPYSLPASMLVQYLQRHHRDHFATCVIW